MLEFLNDLDSNVEIATAAYSNFKEFIQHITTKDRHCTSFVHLNIRNLRKHYDEFAGCVEMAKIFLKLSYQKLET